MSAARNKASMRCRTLLSTRRPSICVRMRTQKWTSKFRELSAKLVEQDDGLRLIQGLWFILNRLT